MSNENNLKPIRSKDEAREKGRKGGKASGKKRREQRTVRELLETILDGKAKDNSYFAKIAESIGVSDKKSIKEIYTFLCLLNSTKRSDLRDLELMARLLGEEGVTDENDGILGELTEFLKHEKNAE